MWIFLYTSLAWYNICKDTQERNHILVKCVDLLLTKSQTGCNLCRHILERSHIPVKYVDLPLTRSQALYYICRHTLERSRIPAKPVFLLLHKGEAHCFICRHTLERSRILAKHVALPSHRNSAWCFLIWTHSTENMFIWNLNFFHVEVIFRRPYSNSGWREIWLNMIYETFTDNQLYSYLLNIYHASFGQNLNIFKFINFVYKIIQ